MYMIVESQITNC